MSRQPPARRKKRQGQPGQAKLAVEHSGLYPYLARYLDWLPVKGFSVVTAQRRDSALRQFIAWCDERALDHPGQITKPMIERYQRHLYYRRHQKTGEPLSFVTQHHYLTAIKAWFKWLTQENYLPSNPASEVQAIRLPHRLPEAVLSVDEVQALLASIEVSDPPGLRNRAMVEVFYSTGLRRHELCQLQLGDIDPRRQSVYVRKGKGGKDRYTPIGRQALTWVQRYLEQARPRLQVDVLQHALFLNQQGGALNPSSVGNIVKQLMQAAGIERTGSCHLLRHAMATHMLENGADLRHLQAILGHSNINTTTIYTHLSIDSLLQAHQATHPTER